MKTKNILISALALVSAAFLSVSCAKDAVPGKTEIPEGYTEIRFGSELVMDYDGKAVLNGLSTEWTGDEKINVWYQENDVTKKVAATMLSHSGKTAYFSIVLPETASKDHLIAEMNASIDGTSKDIFAGFGARFYVPTAQAMTAGSFDPKAFSLGADWKETGTDTTPHFTFRPLPNLLKITVTNNTSKAINEIVLNNDIALSGKNNWNFFSGYLAVVSNTDEKTYISLSGELPAGETKDYYFAIMQKNNLSSGKLSKLTNMSLTFNLAGHFTRVFSNSTPLQMEYSSIATLGSFSIEEKDLVKDESTLAPFGTTWSIGFIKEWYKVFQSGVWYHNAAADAPNETVMASVLSRQGTGPNNTGSRITGAYEFEFYAAEAGTGILTFTSQGGGSGHKVNVCVNNETKHTLEYSDNSTKLTQSYELTVSKGDKISIVYGNGSNWCYLHLASGDLTEKYNLTWVKKTE